MQYAILCYDSETLVGSWSQQKDDALMVRLGKVQDGLDAKGKLGPVARLLPTTAAVTVRPGQEPLVIDGPFAETKEQLLGFYVVDCDTLEEVIEVAKSLLHESGAMEIRPVRVFRSGARR
jgi:hypothetical protein